MVILSLLYSLIPGFTRITIGDNTSDLNTFFGDSNINQIIAIISIFSILTNSTFVFLFMYVVESQYNKYIIRFQSYMKDVTYLIGKNYLTSKDLNEHKIIKSKMISKYLFLALDRRINALSWLELRSFLYGFSKRLFGRQELPTFGLLLVTVLIELFLVIRIFFHDIYDNDSNPNPFASILFNGVFVLFIIFLCLLIRIAVTGYHFTRLQHIQEKLLIEQKVYLRCQLSSQFSYSISNNTNTNVKINRGANDLVTPADSGTSDHDEFKSKEKDFDQLDRKNKEKKQRHKKKIKFKHGNINNKLNYEYNLHFINDIMHIVQRKQIYPRLFGVKLDSVVAKTIATLLLSITLSMIKAFG